MIRRLAIVGVGLLGGSAAKAARVLGVAREIVGVGRDATRLRPAVEDGTLDRATVDLADGVGGADLVLLCAPVLAIEELLGRVWPHVSGEAVVTDVGSTKAGIVRTAEALRRRRDIAFVGSHPMAGSERSGYGAARADLFRGATVVVTPGETAVPRAVKTVTGFWEALGARVTALSPDAHDRAVAAISHLPHLVAYALVEGVVRWEPEALALAARGFRDTTRIAAADPGVWTEIFVANRAALLESLAQFRRSLDELEAAITSGAAAQLTDRLDRIKARREALA